MVILVGDKISDEQIKLAGGDWKYNLNKGFETQYRELSVQLNNVCKLLVESNEVESNDLCHKLLQEYKDVPGTLGKYTLTQHLEKILSLEGGRMIAAERAMTASIILGR